MLTRSTGSELLLKVAFVNMEKTKREKERELKNVDTVSHGKETNFGCQCCSIFSRL